MKKVFIRVEGFNTPPFRALKKGIKPRIQIPYKNNIPRPFRAGLLILTIAFLVIGLMVVQAQTAQQQRELEQIAKRSVNGLSAQDRQRAIQIMTDMLVAQGMSRQQAAAFAEANVETLFFTDIVEMDPEERRMFEEQEERLRFYEGTDERLRQAQEQERRETEQRRLYPGETRSWPTATMFSERGFGNLRQPAGTNASYNASGGSVYAIFLTGANANTLQDLKRQIETITGRTMNGSGNSFSCLYREGGSG